MRGTSVTAVGLTHGGGGMPTMGSHRDRQPASCGLGAGDGRADNPRTRFADAVTELRRLTRDQFFRTVECLLAERDRIPGGSGVTAEVARKLQVRSAEYLRVAAELEAAASCCRVIERELRLRIDPLLTGSAGQLATTGQHTTDGFMVGIRRSGLDGWMRKIFHPRRAVRAQVIDGPPHASPELRPVAPKLSAACPLVLPTPTVPEADVAVLVLGPLELRVAGRWVLRWNSLKARAVFQYLLIHQGGPVRRDVLMELQWPDHSHDSARNNLNVALYSLRNTLVGPEPGVQPVLYRDGCYLLNPELTWWIDRNEFLHVLSHAQSARLAGRTRQAVDAYQRVVQLYRGELFEDDPTGEWYLPEQLHLKELYLQALRELAESHIDLGDLHAAVQFGQLAISTDPCCEPAHRLLMRCFSSEHQQQLVSRQYRLCVTALHDELGVPPAVETVQLFHDLISTRYGGPT